MKGRTEARPEPADEHEKLAGDLSALANSQRLRLLHLLTRPRYGEEIATSLGMSRQSALKHIEKLEERGFVRALHGRRATGPVIEYQVVPQRLFALGVGISDLGRLEPKGGPAVRHAERTSILQGGGDPAAAAEPEPVSQYGRLIVVNGPRSGSAYPLGGEAMRWTIGRDQDRDIVMAHDPFVSGGHAEVQRGPTGVDLVDSYSANGTFVNFARLPRGGRVPLAIGDVVGVGHTFLVYQKG